MRTLIYLKHQFNILNFMPVLISDRHGAGFRPSRSFPLSQTPYNEIIRFQESLVEAIAEVFLIALFVVSVAFLINLFIKEIPLRRFQNISPGKEQ